MTGPFDPAPHTGPDAGPGRNPDDLADRRRRGRATVMALLLAALVVLIFAITIAKIRAGMAH